MIRIGNRVPYVSIPALMGGVLQYVDWTRFQGRWTALCCVPHLGLIEACFLDRQVEPFAQEGAALLAIGPDGDFLRQPWITQIGTLRLPILGDPLARLRRGLGIAPPDSPARCRTFLIDPDGFLQFRLVHDLNGRGMDVVRMIIGVSQGRTPPTTPLSPGNPPRLAVGGGA